MKHEPSLGDTLSGAFYGVLAATLVALLIWNIGLVAAVEALGGRADTINLLDAVGLGVLMLWVGKLCDKG